MKYFVFFVLILSLTSCSFFQGQTSVGEEKVQEMQEIFVPVDKELYVISHTALQYTEPDLLSNPDKQVNSFGDLFEIEAESEHFYKIKSNWDWYLRKEDMGSYEDIQFTKEVLEDVHFIGKREGETFVDEKEGTTLSKYFTIDMISYEAYQKAKKNGYFPLVKDTLAIK